jgi:signal transduction histidine kinase
VVNARELVILRKDGTPIPMLSSAAPVYDRSERIAGAVSAWQDISERKLAERRLAQSQKMESVAFLAAGVAHRFNNLLTPMIGFAHMLREELSPEKAHMADAIAENGERAAELIRHLLAYAGEGSFVIRQVDLSDAVRSIWNLLEASLPDLVRLHQDLQAGLPAIAADAEQIRQIVVNLVRNGVEAIPQGRRGAVSVRTSLEEITTERAVFDQLSHTPLGPGRYICLEVQDDGAGIERTVMPDLFDPFFSTKFTGRGLGLPAAAGVARAHRGAIEVVSTPRRGSIFRVYFPVFKTG